MRPKPITEFVIFKLTYVYPNDDIEPPFLENQSNGQEPPTRLAPFRDWYCNAMTKEYSSIPRGNNIRFSLWRMKSGDTGLFTLKDIRFDKLYFFVGEATIYWIFFKHGDVMRFAQGTTPLTINYCTCCLDEKYMEFVEIIKGNLDESSYVLT